MPDPEAAQALPESLGGQFGEMRTMMQYLFQKMNFRKMRPLKDLLRSIATEEMGRVELVANTIKVKNFNFLAMMKRGYLPYYSAIGSRERPSASK